MAYLPAREAASVGLRPPSAARFCPILSLTLSLGIFTDIFIRLSQEFLNQLKLGRNALRSACPNLSLGIIQPASPEEAIELAYKILSLSEKLFVHFEEFARNEEADGLLHSMVDLKDLRDEDISDMKLAYELFRLTDDIDRFLASIEKSFESSRSFLLEEVGTLPEELQRDFVDARDLFSIHKDEMGLFQAARGLERTARKVSEMLDLSIVFKKGRKSPLAEEALGSMCQGMRRAKWADNSRPILTGDSKTILDNLRQSRNLVAHASEMKLGGFRERAVIAAKSAVCLWEESKAGTREVEQTVIVKDW